MSEQQSAENDAACMCGEPESTHGWGDPPHMFTPQGSEALPQRCLTCESWGRRHCGEHSGTPIPPASTDPEGIRAQWASAEAAAG